MLPPTQCVVDVSDIANDLAVNNNVDILRSHTNALAQEWNAVSRIHVLSDLGNSRKA